MSGSTIELSFGSNTLGETIEQCLLCLGSAIVLSFGSNNLGKTIALSVGSSALTI